MTPVICRYCRWSTWRHPSLHCLLFDRPATTPQHPKCWEREPGSDCDLPGIDEDANGALFEHCDSGLCFV